MSAGDGSRLRHVATVDELADAGRIIVESDGREIAVFDQDGEYYALSNYCVHQGGPVCEGLVTGTLTVNDEFDLVYSAADRAVVCPWHGWEFDIETGMHLSKTGLGIPTYDVVVRDENVYLEL